MALPPILITGASGFVGGRLLQRLRPEEFDRVCCVGRTISPAMRLLADWPQVTCLGADLPDRPLPDDALSSVETVVHLAAATGKARPAAYFATNVAGTRALLEQCARRGVRNVLF